MDRLHVDSDHCTVITGVLRFALFSKASSAERPFPSFTATGVAASIFLSAMDILCVYCFDVLLSELDKRSAIPFPAALLAKTSPNLLTSIDSDSHDVVSIDTN